MNQTTIRWIIQKFRPYIGDMKNYLKKSGEWKIYLTMKMSFLSSKYSNQKRLIHYENDNKETMTSFDTSEIIFWKMNLFNHFFTEISSRFKTTNKG